MSDNPIIYRKRLIPSECILLKDDSLIYRDEDILITTWHTLHAKKEFDHGSSCYLIKEGWKVSRFLRPDGSLLYWYCDIIHTDHDPESDTYIFEDLLADVIIYPDGSVRVVDLNELADALDDGLITLSQLKSSIRRLDHLLQEIYDKMLFEREPIKKLLEV